MLSKLIKNKKIIMYYKKYSRRQTAGRVSTEMTRYSGVLFSLSILALDLSSGDILRLHAAYWVAIRRECAV